jgi:hypothetical protein
MSVRCKLLIVGLLGTIIAAQSAPAFADYGAFAFDDGAHKFGYSWNEENERRAGEVALKACGTDKCKIVFSTGPRECAAIAMTTDDHIWGGAKRPRRDAAELAAIESCQKRTSNQCKIRTSECNR